MSFGRLYTPQIKKFDDWDHITPNVEKFEGIRPWLGTTVAPYLPLARWNQYDRDWFVLNTGKVMALALDGFLVPAGLKLEQDLVTAAGDVSAATMAYTATDVQYLVKNSNGDTCTAGEKVVASMFPIGSVTGATGKSTRPVGTAQNTVSYPIGISAYSYYRASSDDLTPAGSTSSHAVWSPTELRYTNYNKQGRVAVLCDYVCEYPVVASYSPPFAGIAVFVGITVKPGDFVSYDINSNLCLANPSSFDWRDIMGQVIRVQTSYPRDYLERVKTRYDGTEGPDFNQLDKMPGTATEGYPDVMTYSGSTFGTVLINLITR